jgi:hypothetical protein
VRCREWEREKGLAAQETGHVVELCPLARPFAWSSGVSGRMESFVDLSNYTTYSQQIAVDKIHVLVGGVCR